MSADVALTEIKKNFKKRGGPAMRNVRKKIIENFNDDSPFSQSLRYFSEVTLQNALPVFPALLTLSCEAVGGNIKKTLLFGEALVLASASADLHDDVIDQSLMKGSKLTVLGKFDAGIAILAGDILLMEGFKKIVEASKNIPEEQGDQILTLFYDAVNEICKAEAMEIRMRKNPDLQPSEFLEVIRLKAVVPELSMKMGAILGSADSESIEALGQFGRVYGINSAIIEEILDLLNFEELRNRLKHECPPLPMINANQNPSTKTALKALLNADLTKRIHKKLVDVVMDSNEVNKIKEILVSNARSQKLNLQKVREENIREELQNLLAVPLKFIET